MKFKKPKFWDKKKPTFLSYLLLPFSFPLIINNFFLGLSAKNVSYPEIKKICIGNIYIGGTGKTPLVIEIFKILKKLNYRTATIKKFYKEHIDEQKMLKDYTMLYCLKDRKMALENAIKDNNQIALFDDGLQDKSINYDLKFVCFNSSKWVGNGLLMPAGPLREKINSISKYDAVFINGDETNAPNLKLSIKKYNKNIKIFESHYKATNASQFDTSKRYLIFSGIGNPQNFKDTLIQNKFNIIKEIIFPDHYDYNQSDIDNIKLQAKNLDARIMTTEKDYTKINSNKNSDIHFLKVELDIKNKEDLIDYLKLCI